MSSKKIKINITEDNKKRVLEIESKDIENIVNIVRNLVCESPTKYVTVGDLNSGDRFRYGGIEWVKLDTWRKEDLSIVGSLILSVDTLFYASFDDRGETDWKKSGLRATLNANSGACFTAPGVSKIRKDDLVEFTRRLTSEDDPTDLGTCNDLISLYTCDEYYLYRIYIPQCRRHWTSTGKNHLGSHYVNFVASDGSLNFNSACVGSIGVRPLCVLKEDVQVEKI